MKATRRHMLQLAASGGGTDNAADRPGFNDGDSPQTPRPSHHGSSRLGSISCLIHLGLDPFLSRFITAFVLDSSPFGFGLNPFHYPPRLRFIPARIHYILDSSDSNPFGFRYIFICPDPSYWILFECDSFWKRAVTYHARMDIRVSISAHVREMI